MIKSKNIIKLHKNNSSGQDSLTVPADLKKNIPNGSFFQPFLECCDNRLKIVYEMMSPATISTKIPGQQDQPYAPKEMVDNE